MEFERYNKSKKGIKYAKKPMVSIWSQGLISFNIGAVREYGINNFSHVILFYDKDAQTIGIMLTNNGKESGAIKLTRIKKRGFVFSARRFFKHYGIDFSKNTKHDLLYDEKEGMFKFNLVNAIKKEKRLKFF